MSKTTAHSLSHKGTMSTKLVMGFLVAATSVFVSTAGVANAMEAAPANTPPSKEACKNDGWASYADESGKPFKNQGLCIKWANDHNNDHGYGGGNTGGNISIGVGDIIGDNNVINIIINYFVG